MLRVQPKNISTYQDLLDAKQDLREEVNLLEDDIRNNNIVKISSSIVDGTFMKESLFDSFTNINFKNIISSPLSNIASIVISNLLLSNKKLRKYFIAFTIAKDSILTLANIKNKK